MLSLAEQAIDPVVSSTNITSVFEISSLDSQLTTRSTASCLNIIRIKVILTFAVAVPATVPSSPSEGVNVRVTFSNMPVGKLKLKKSLAWVLSAAVMVTVVIARRPARTPASHACCNRDWTM